ncbi:unnamed protein product [Musa acuminata subsp. burmannicoides]
MAKSRILLVVFLLLVMVEIYTFNGQHVVDAQKIDCGAKCAYRCSKSSRPNLCNRACNTCCSRCNCVPPGTDGNRDVCPCYANMKTHGGRPKCP